MMRDAASGKMPVAEMPATCPEYPGVAALFTAPAPALTESATNVPALWTHARVVLADYTPPEATHVRAKAGRGPPQENPS